MRKSFGEMYRYVCLEPQGDLLKNRMEGMQDFCKTKGINIIELSKMFFRLPVEESFKASFIGFYAAKDLAFPSNNDRELALLAGLTLIELLEKEKYEIIIVLTVMCLTIFHQELIIPELPEIILERFSEITATFREIDVDKNKTINIGIIEFRNEFESSGWDANTTKSFSELLLKLSNKITMLQNNQNNLIDVVKIYREDSNILAWLIGEWSNDLIKPLNNNIRQNKIALILGKELADLVDIIPGPYSAKAYLGRMLKLCKNEISEVSLMEMVDLIDEGWKNNLLNKYKLIGKGENTPILLAISKSLEVSEAQIWKHTYKKSIGIEVENVKSDTLTWAYQIYLECLLIKYKNSEE